MTENIHVYTFYGFDIDFYWLSNPLNVVDVLKNNVNSTRTTTTTV